MFESIQGFRFAAAMLVVFLHTGKALALAKYFNLPILEKPFAFGDAGVTFFFVLSGFLITRVHSSDIGHPARLLTYLRKRATRIYPAYWIVLFASAILLTYSGFDYPLDTPTVLKTIALAPQNREVVGGTGAPILIVAWSLQYEMFFYAYFSLFILNAWIGLAATSLLAVNFMYCRFEVCTFPQTFASSIYVLLFVFGAVTALICKTTFTTKRPLLLAVGCSALFLGLGLYESFSEVRWMNGRQIIYGIISCLIIFGCVRAEEMKKVQRGHRPLLALSGDISYALYLIHFPLVSLLCKIAVRILPINLFGGVVAFLVISVICVLVATAFYLLVERPLLKLLSFRKRVATPTIQAVH